MLSKIFITWYVYPPDPFYWIWIEDVKGIVVTFSSISKRLIDKFSVRGLKSFLGFNGVILVDSLTAPLKNYYIEKSHFPQYFLLNLQRSLGADILIHKDYPLISKNLTNKDKTKLLLKTIRNAEVAIKIAEKLGAEIMLVIQGWNIESYLYTAKKYRELGIKYAGIGSLIYRRNNKNELVKIVKSIRDELNSYVHIHLFGVMSPGILSEILKYVNSFDVSTPMKAAIAREAIVIRENRIKRIKLDHLSINDLIFDNKSAKLAEKIFSATNARELKNRLAIYNTYVLFKWFKSIGE